MLSFHLNLAACCLKTQKWDRVVKECGEVLKLDPNNAKAYYRRGCAHMEGDIDLSKADLEKAAELDPGNKGVKKELKRLETKFAAYRKKEAATAAKMFG